MNSRVLFLVSFCLTTVCDHSSSSSISLLIGKRIKTDTGCTDEAGQKGRPFDVKTKTHRACISLGLKNGHGHWLFWMSTGRKNRFTLSELQSHFGGKPVKSQVLLPRNGTAFLKGSSSLGLQRGKWTTKSDDHDHRRGWCPSERGERGQQEA